MTPHTLGTTTLDDSQLPSSGMVVQTHLTIAINLGPRGDVTVRSALATPAYGNEQSSPPQIVPGTEAQPTAQIDALVSDADEFTSVPFATAAAPVIGDLGPTSVEANGTGNGHTTLVG